jgi:hypothetical protein
MTSPSSPTTTAEGGCLCGALRYRVTGPSSAPTLCHCRSCRRAAGSPVVAWVTFPIAAFAFVAGEPVSFRSSPPVTRTFCGTCGTPLTYAHDRLPNEIDITTCSLDDPEAYPPRDQVWTSHELSWWPGVEQLPSFPRRRGDTPNP